MKLRPLHAGLLQAGPLLTALALAAPCWFTPDSAAAQSSPSSTQSPRELPPPPPAAGPPAPVPSISPTVVSATEARAVRYRQAIDLLKAEQVSAAYRAFLALWTEQPSYDVAMALGQIELLNAQYDAAARHFAYAKQHVPPTDAFKQGETIAQGHQAATAHVRVVTVQLIPADAQLWLDGEQPEGRSGNQVTLYLRAGKYQVRVERDGYLPYHAEHVSSGTSEETLTIQLQRAPASSPPTGTGHADASPSAPLGRTLWMAIGGGAALGTGAIGTYLVNTAETGVRDNRPIEAGSVGPNLLLSSVGLSLATSIGWQVWGAVTDVSGRGVLERTLLLGSSSGTAPVPKQATVFTLHAASVALLGLGIWQTVEAQTLRSDQRDYGSAGLCSDNAGDSRSECGHWLGEQDRVTTIRNNAAMLLAGAGMSHVLALALAEWWPNSGQKGNQP